MIWQTVSPKCAQTSEPETKPRPVSVIRSGRPSAVTSGGSIESMDGTGLPIVNFNGEDSPPPGAGFTTVTDSMPAPDTVRNADRFVPTAVNDCRQRMLSIAVFLKKIGHLLDGFKKLMCLSQR